MVGYSLSSQTDGQHGSDGRNRLGHVCVMLEMARALPFLAQVGLCAGQSVAVSEAETCGKCAPLMEFLTHLLFTLLPRFSILMCLDVTSCWHMFVAWLWLQCVCGGWLFTCNAKKCLPIWGQICCFIPTPHANIMLLEK